MSRGASFLTLQDGTRMHYRLQGRAGAPVIVLLNGLLSDLSLWAGAVSRLQARFRLLRLDSRGQGLTEAVRGPFSQVQGAADVREALALLGLERPWLAGLSNGSSVALELLSGTPDAFAGAVLASAVARLDFSTELRLRHWLRCLELGGPLLQFEAAAPLLWGDRFLEQRYALLRAFHETATGLRQGGAEGARRQIEDALPWDIRERLGAVRAPVLLLCGAEDLLTPPWKCLETAQRLPGSRFEVVPGVGHAFPVEDPEAFSRRIQNFVDEVETSI